MAMVDELNNQDQTQDKFVYACNNCKEIAQTRYQCTVCVDFDLCVDCFSREGHEHKMEKCIFGSADDSASRDQKKVYTGESNQLLSIQRCIKYIVHACQCRDTTCRLPSCPRMKRLILHAKSCKKKTNGICPICKQFIALSCFHAKKCQEDSCQFPFCSCIKHKLRQRELQERSRQVIRRRIIDFQNHDIFGCRRRLPRGLM